MSDQPSQFTRRQALGWLAAGAAPAVLAQGAPYPARPIRVIVPFPPGGGTDVVARMFTARLSTALGQSLVVENKAGATGVIGTAQAAQSAADGYNLLIGSLSSHVLAPLTAEGKSADAVRDFAPIALLAYHPMVVVAHPSVKANNLQEFIALGKANPQFYGSIGSGSLFHFAAAEFVQLAGIKAEHVPYKGAAPAMADLLGGQTNFMFDTIQSSLGHIQKGSLKAFAVTGKSRSPLLPGIPTLAEAGLPAFEVMSWVGMFAPAGTPADVIARLSGEVNRLARDTEFVSAAAKTGTDIPHGTPAEFRDLLVKDQRRYSEQFKRINFAAK
jgi:tripartite-type tricarboxylate transporter receptor subunit TctC